MRCSNKPDSWSRLCIPRQFDEFVRRELDDAKVRSEDVREIARSSKLGPGLDQEIAHHMNLTEELISSGEPWSGLIMSATTYVFSYFLRRALHNMSPDQVTALWVGARQIAPEIGIDLSDVFHPRDFLNPELIKVL